MSTRQESTLRETGRFLWLNDLGRDARFALRSLARTPGFRDVIGLVMRQAAGLTGAGIAVGLAGALAFTSVLESLLHGVSVRDPLTYARPRRPARPGGPPRHPPARLARLPRGSDPGDPRGVDEIRPSGHRSTGREGFPPLPGGRACVWERRLGGEGTSSSLYAYSCCRLNIMIEDDIRRCAKMLESVVRMDGLSARQLEEKLGYGAGTVNRLFSGKIELKLRHILLILEVIGIQPSQFFREAFPEDDRARSEPEMASRLLDLLERAPRRTRPAASGLTDDELDRRILEALGRLGVTPQQQPGGRRR